METDINQIPENIRLLNASEICQILRISRAKAYQLMNTGEIPTVRIGRSVRVLLTDLEEFIANRRANVFGE